MKIGFLTACVPGIELEELVKWASENGFQSLELAAWPVESDRDYQAKQIDAANMDVDKASKILDLFNRYQITISAMAYYDNNLHPDLKKRQSYINHLKKVIDVAEMLNVSLVGTFVGGRPDKTPAENISEIRMVFSDIVKYAGDRGVKIMIENCPMYNWLQFGAPGNYAYSPELWDALFNEIPDENFGLNFDPSHLYFLGIDHIQAVKDYSAKIFHAHAKDTEMLTEGKYRYGVPGKQLQPEPWKSGWWQYRMPGLGEIDWKRFILTLQECGYEHVLSIEHEDPVWEGSEEKIKSGLKKGLKHLKQYVI
jgi:sugar phosphate isomerase/epimerase